MILLFERLVQVSFASRVECKKSQKSYVDIFLCGRYENWKVTLDGLSLLPREDSIEDAMGDAIHNRAIEHG